MKKVSVCFFFLFLWLATLGFSQGYLKPEPTPIAKYLKPITLTETKSQLPGVDCIYVINLDDRTNKWARVKQLFDEKKLKVNRVSAVNGKALPTSVKDEMRGPYPPMLRDGEIGCFLSHLSILKDAYIRGFDVIWVMEDDVEFKEDIRQLPELLRQLQAIDPHWDTFYTDVDSTNEKREYIPSLSFSSRPDQLLKPLIYYLQRSPVTPDIMKIGQRFGMYSVFISKKGIKKILDFCTHIYLYNAIDVDIHYVPGIRQYSARRDVVGHWPGNSFSDTNNNRQGT